MTDYGVMMSQYKKRSIVPFHTYMFSRNVQRLIKYATFDYQPKERPTLFRVRQYFNEKFDQLSEENKLRYRYDCFFYIF